jgi:ABC-2 type transport system permease protein
MKWSRISAMLIKHRYNFKRDIFRVFDIFWWPAFSLFIWGIFSGYIADSTNTQVNFVALLVGGIILWTFYERASKDISLAFVDELWNKNFINLFSTPLSISEYLVSVMIMALGKLLLSALFMVILASVFYAFNITSIGWFFVPAAVGLTVTGWTMSILVQSCIMRWGYTVEVFIWAVATLTQPFSCVFYPLKALPVWMQNVAVWLPTTYLFENMRSAIMGQGINTGQVLISFALNILYFIIALIVFFRTFNLAREQGLIVKNY